MPVKIGFVCNAVSIDLTHRYIDYLVNYKLNRVGKICRIYRFGVGDRLSHVQNIK
jgi:hypothetical protein